MLKDTKQLAFNFLWFLVGYWRHFILPFFLQVAYQANVWDVAKLTSKILWNHFVKEDEIPVSNIKTIENDYKLTPKRYFLARWRKCGWLNENENAKTNNTASPKRTIWKGGLEYESESVDSIWVWSFSFLSATRNLRFILVILERLVGSLGSWCLR